MLAAGGRLIGSLFRTASADLHAKVWPVDELKEIEAVPLHAGFRRFVVEAQGSNDTLVDTTDEIPRRTGDKRWHRSIFRNSADELIPIRSAEQVVGSHSQPPVVARSHKSESEPAGRRKMPPWFLDDTKTMPLGEPVLQENSFATSKRIFCILLDLIAV
jgi:hypothetical protein